ncbi:MAG: hypothetical protein K8T89_15125 [Planctomycetes bacterium]|nr:hypothetical protein [Planctomycetota bacterium]
MLRHLPLLALMISFATGCAALAKKPATPAAELSVQEMLATPVPPNERYYIIVFGSQSTPLQARYTHSWATIVKATTPADGGAPQIEQHTISWMPASLEIAPLRLHVEPGTNLDLKFTIEEMLRHKERVSMWGPYEIWHGLYHRILTQKRFMESGAVGYQCIDTIGEAARVGNGSDCIHAITDMDPQFDRERYPLAYFGEAASLNIVRQLQRRPVMICPRKTHDWLIPALGLDCYPICRRTYTGKSREFSPEALLESTGKSGSGRSRCRLCE